MYFLYLIATVFMAAGPQIGNAALNEPLNGGMTVGDVEMLNSFPTQSSRIGLGTDGSVYLVSLLAHGESRLMRISQKGAAEKLIMYRGRPYLLDKRERLFGFRPSVMRELRTKLPYIGMRALKTIHWALLSGTGLYIVALLDQTFTGLITIPAFDTGHAFLGGIMLYYGLDIGHTVLFSPVRDLRDGGNFFTDLIMKRVQSVTRHPKYDDYVVTIGESWGAGTKDQPLSQIVKSPPGNCIDYMTKLILR